MTLSRAIIDLLIAFVVSCAGTAILIPVLKKKQFGQYIREDGPQGHLSKAGTPTMGGLAIILGITVAVLFATRLNWATAAVLLTMYAFGAIGFVDDYNKIAKKENEGLKPKQKIALQLVFGVVLAIFMMMKEGTMVFIPFFKVSVNFGLLYIPFVVFVEIAMANAVNLTDGLDGLAASTTTIVALLFAVVKWAAFTEGRTGVTGSSLAVAGALLGFLVFNKYPAKIFMGDTGSMALGGVLSAIAIVGRLEFLLCIAGLLYVCEALSVIIQVGYFKKTGGKRIFRMAPLHHHFELGGWSEVKVVVVFSLFTLLCCVIGYFSVI